MTNLLRNCSLEVDGRSFPRRIKTLQLPKLTIKTEDYRAGGMDAAVKVDMGMEPLEAGFTMSSIDAELLKLFGLTKEKETPLVFRGALRDDDGTVTAVLVSMRGQVTELDPGDWKPGEISETKYMASLRYYKFEHPVGTPVHEIDIDNYRRVIDGVDQLAEMRQALGL